MTGSETGALDARLLSVYSFIRHGSTAVDVGSDHARLVCALVENGVCPFASATDINPLPLENTRAEISRRGLQNKIKTYLCDGLSQVPPNSADDIIIAGMGGELICKIISGASWLCDKNKRLALQPMTKADRLRTFLYQSGFEILKERASQTDGRLYTALSVAYTGKKRSITPVFAKIGLLPLDSSPEASAYIREQAHIAQKISFGLSLSSSNTDKLQALWFNKLSNDLISVANGGDYCDFRP